jgi:hypothetical protein
MLGLAWPFQYDKSKDQFQLDDEKSPAHYSDFEIKHLNFTLGPCIKSKSKNIPVVTYRFSKTKTSQGKIVLTRTKVYCHNFNVEKGRQC